KFSLGKLTIMFFLISLPFLIMMAGQWHLNGSPFYFLTAQKQWGREFNILMGLANHLPINPSLNYLFLMLSLYTGFYLWKKGDHTSRLLAIFTVVMAEVPVFFGVFQSYYRFMMINIGIFVFLSQMILKYPFIMVFYLIWGVTNLVKRTFYWVEWL
ncbi:MAG: hypothetical protein OXB84_09180, partial [Halobacteriovoraceae bacterium]|nr:hypothetical protein [Halobacteriovoraceae bacterium]